MLNFSGLQVTLVRVFILLVRCASIPHFHYTIGLILRIRYGDAAKNVSKEVKKHHGEIDWKGLAGMRDKLVQHYFGVSWNVLWDVIQNKLPEMKSKLDKIPREAK